MNYMTKFFTSFSVDPDTKCWEWDALTHRQGYGWLHFQGKYHLAHRVAWFIFWGRMPQPKEAVCHKCDNPKCVNPDHLFVGTQKDNVADCIAKGRARKGHPIGSKNPRAIFTEEQVRNILRDTRKQRDIAREHGCAESTISMIKRGNNWPQLFAEQNT